MSLLLPLGAANVNLPVPTPPGDVRVPGLPQGQKAPLRATYVDVITSSPTAARPAGLPVGWLGQVGAWDGSRKTTTFVDAKAARALAVALSGLADYLEGQA
jgi:hypothetical protein